MFHHHTNLAHKLQYLLLGITTTAISLTPLAAPAFPVRQPTTNEQSQSTLIDVAEIAKPAIIRIESSCSGKIYSRKTGKTYEAKYGGSASGFFISPYGDFIGSAHAVFFAHRKEDCHRVLLQSVFYEMLAENEINPEDPPDDLIKHLLAQTELRDLETKRIAILPNGDRLPYEVSMIGAPIGEGKDVAILKVNVQNAPTLLLADSSKTRLLQSIIAAGYPVSGESSVLNSSSSLQPSFTAGSISAFKTMKDGSPVLQFSAPTTHGGSGGPVLNEKGKVEAITTFGGDTETSGYAFGVLATTIAEMLQQAGIKNEDSPTNALYRDAIALYNQGQYGRALSKFLELQKLFPQHSEVARFLISCRQQIQARSN